MMHEVRSARFSRGWLAVLVVVAVAAVSLVWGCTSAFAASPSPSATGQVVLKLGWTEEPDNLNVFIGYADTTYEIWALNYSYLFGAGDHNQPTLDLASEFPTQQNGGISPDGKVWTIHIRSGVKFQDGVPLTASDVAFTYNYIIKNQMANLLNNVQGIESAKALNPTTVQFTCAHSMATGYMEAPATAVPILPEHIWKNVSPNAAITSYGNKPPIIGSGPFETVAFNKGAYVEMVRNPYYYGKMPTVTKIYFETYQNSSTMVSDLLGGKIDGAWGIPAATFSQLKGVKGIEAAAYPYYEWSYLEFNCYNQAGSLGNPVLRDPKFRQAINYALDKQRLASLAYDGLATPATTILPPNTWTNPDYHWQPPASEAYTFDIAKANQMLTAAGYPLKNGVRVNKQGKPIVLRLYAATDDAPGDAMAKLITGWLQQLGLTIKLSVIDSGTLTSDIYNYQGNNPAPNFDMVIWWWYGWFDPGQTMNALMTSQEGNLNEPWWSNAEYDKLAVEQVSATNPQQRQAIVWQMQQLMYQQSPWIPLTYPDTLEAWNTAKWTGWTRQFNGTGGAWELEGNISSYLNLQPKVAVASTTGSSSSTIVIVIVVVAVVVVGGIGYMVIRRRRQHVEEDEA
jgi:peptide/nickel transport system substrate-binding protein